MNKFKFELLKGSRQPKKEQEVYILADDERNEKIDDSIFFIEANSFEQFSLWEKWHIETNWEQDTSGIWQTIGHINDDVHMPINVSFSFAKIYGKRICFYYCMSRYSDYFMIEEFIKANYPKRYDSDSKWAMTDATNFHHAVHRCKNKI